MLLMTVLFMLAALAAVVVAIGFLAAIEVLFDVSRRLGRRRQQLRLVMPPDSPLRRVIELTEVHTAAPVYESLDAAVTQ